MGAGSFLPAAAGELEEEASFLASSGTGLTSSSTAGTDRLPEPVDDEEEDEEDDDEPSSGISSASPGNTLTALGPALPLTLLFRDSELRFEAARPEELISEPSRRSK